MKKIFLIASLAVCFFTAMFVGACTAQSSENGSGKENVQSETETDAPDSLAHSSTEESDGDSIGTLDPDSGNNDIDLPEVDF